MGTIDSTRDCIGPFVFRGKAERGGVSWPLGAFTFSSPNLHEDMLNYHISAMSG
jgi:hypothetical protein